MATMNDDQPRRFRVALVGRLAEKGRDLADVAGSMGVHKSEVYRVIAGFGTARAATAGKLADGVGMGMGELWTLWEQCGRTDSDNGADA